MHTFVPSTCARLAWQCLSKSSIVLLSPGTPNARTRMTFNVPGHWREMSSFPVPSAERNIANGETDKNVYREKLVICLLYPATSFIDPKQAGTAQLNSIAPDLIN